MGMRSGAAVVGVLFIAGLGAGFAWREGKLPIEFLPPHTGVLDDAGLESTAPDDLSKLDSAPVAATSVPGQVTVEVPPLFDDLTEPAPQSAPLPTQAAILRRAKDALPSPAGGVAPASATVIDPRSDAGAVRSADFTKDAAPGSPAEPSLADLDEIDRRIAAGEILAAHKSLSQIYWREPARRAEIQERIDHTAGVIFFSPQPHFVDPHVVQAGDRLEAIAAQHRLSWEYLSRLNKIDPKRIRAGQRLKLVRGPFSAVVELSDFSLTVHLQGYYVKRYVIGIGKDGSTPLGRFPVLNKVVNPQYTDPDGRVFEGTDPDNPLGERWIDLGDSYGIHGTIDPDSVGRAASRGCIRLRNDDIVELYDFLIIGSEVAIRR
jgi:LysM repeat protein